MLAFQKFLDFDFFTFKKTFMLVVAMKVFCDCLQIHYSSICKLTRNNTEHIHTTKRDDFEKKKRPTLCINDIKDIFFFFLNNCEDCLSHFSTKL